MSATTRASLAAAIEVKLRLVLDGQTIIDLSRNRDTTATENTARTAAVALMAADDVQAVLGDEVDGNDYPAVALATRLAALHWSQLYNMVLTPEGLAWLQGVENKLEVLRSRRMRAAVGPTEPAENDRNLEYIRELDALYPTPLPWDPTARESAS